MISQEIDKCLVRIQELQMTLSSKRNDALAYQLQIEDKQIMQRTAETRAIEAEKALELELHTLQGLMSSLQHFSPHLATAGSLFERLEKPAEPNA